MAETWYFRTGTGAACGPGTRRPLNQSAGTAASTQDVSSEHTWNRTESERSIAAGNWSVVLDVTTGSGGGAPNRVTAVVERRNSSCVVQQEILNVQSGNLTAGATEEITLGPVDPGLVSFSSGDILTVRVVRSNGTRAQTLRFDSTAASNADSRLIHPDVGGTDVTVNTTGNPLSASAGSITITGSASVSPTGSAGTVSAGSGSVSGSAGVAPSGVSLTATGGAVSVTGTASVTATGSGLLASPGTVVAEGTSPDVEVFPSGSAATVSSGAASVSGSAVFAVSGAAMSAATGSPAIAGNASVALSGVQLQILIGDEQATGDEEESLNSTRVVNLAWPAMMDKQPTPNVFPITRRK